MKPSLFIFLLLALSCAPSSKKSDEKFQSLSFGNVLPSGWLREQMQRDVDGFVGNLDKLVPDLINDPIYGSGRLQKNSKAKDLGNKKEGDAEGDEQYKWWNSETQSNWWDGYLRHVLLLRNEEGIAKVKKYVATMLATQDDDGYLGIYAPELRYQFQGENGELWAKATLYRGLLAYYEYTHDEAVFQAVVRAVNNVMKNYPIHASHPFHTGNAFNGGVSHGLTFTDVLERLYQRTHDQTYRDYALFLYTDFSSSYQSEGDAQLPNILNTTYALRSHGVHTYEHLRSLIISRYASGQAEYQQALAIYLQRLQRVSTPSGGAIGDEWIAGRAADATHTGYEYCSLQELLDSYCLLYQKTGTASLGDAIETIFYNAAQGARHPTRSCIAYLKTDNSYEMEGTKNGEVEPDRKQTRYKYSPAHQDVAVCCNPNAGRVAPYFIQHAWMRENEQTYVATLLAPAVLETTQPDALRIETVTSYPYKNRFQFTIKQAKPRTFTLKIRKPSWVTKIVTKETYTLDEDFIRIERNFSSRDSVALAFETDVQLHQDAQGKHYFTYGALLFAKPIEATEKEGKMYAPSFSDYTYSPLTRDRFLYNPEATTTYADGKIRTTLRNEKTKQVQAVELVPIGKTILRQVTF